MDNSEYEYDNNSPLLTVEHNNDDINNSSRASSSLDGSQENLFSKR